MVEFCGEELDAWFYEPARQAPHPAVVMRGGLGTVKAGGLAPFAERFCREGFAVSAIDCRQWGEVRAGTRVTSSTYRASARTTAPQSIGQQRIPRSTRNGSSRWAPRSPACA
jgi:hypothetical protein